MSNSPTSDRARPVLSPRADSSREEVTVINERQAPTTIAALAASVAADFVSHELIDNAQQALVQRGLTDTPLSAAQWKAILNSESGRQE